MKALKAVILFTFLQLSKFATGGLSLDKQTFYICALNHNF